MKRTQRTTGFGSPAEAYTENDIDWNRLLLPKPHAMYFFSVSGSEYDEFNINDKDLAIVDCSLVPKIGDLVILTADGEFRIGDYTGSEADIIGVVSRLVRLLRLP
ncbi:MAG: S24 family peptidase [Spirochaetota bacterium]|nr:S24 family peptidase [Spirochaetota bacterium]